MLPSPLVIKPDSLYQQELGRNDLLSRSLKKSTRNESSMAISLVGGGDNSASLKRLSNKRKDSVESDNSSESSGESLFKVCVVWEFHEIFICKSVMD